MSTIAPASARVWARVGGGLYAIIIATGFFAIGYIPATILVVGDPATTSQNIVQHALLYRSGIAAHLVTIVCDVFLLWILYELFKVVSRTQAVLLVLFTVIATAVEGANLLIQFTPLLVLSGVTSLNAFTSDQLNATAYMALQLQTDAYNVQQTVFAFYGLVLGNLVYRSTFMPKAVGVLLAFGGVCYLIFSFTSTLAPTVAAALVPWLQLPSLLGEASLCISMLAMGVNVERWSECARAETLYAAG